MKRRFRLTRSTDFQRVRRVGKTYAHPLVVLTAAPNESDRVQIGVAAGRSIGNAVVRNKAKRRMRAALQPLLPYLNGGWDVIFLARKPIREAAFQDICAAIQTLMKRAGLLHDRTDASG